MNEINNELFELFASMLNDRLKNSCDTWQDFINDRGEYLSEDNIRYIFYSAARKIYCDSKIILEYPFGYPDVNRLDYELDSLLRINGNTNYAFEMKYHRNLGTASLKRTEFAGSVFNDLIRLRHFKNRCLTDENTKKYFIYVTDKEMDCYFKNRKNRLNDFYNLPPNNSSFTFDNSFRQDDKSFQKSIKVKLAEETVCTVTKVYERLDLAKEHKLRIWKVN